MQEARPCGLLNLRLKKLDSIPQSWGATESWGWGATESLNLQCALLRSLWLRRREQIRARPDWGEWRLWPKQQELVLGQWPRRWRKQEKLESSLQGWIMTGLKEWGGGTASREIPKVSGAGRGTTGEKFWGGVCRMSRDWDILSLRFLWLSSSLKCRREVCTE